MGSGPPVVKIAGIAGGVGIFHEQIDAAARAGFRVAALDTSGDRFDDPAPGPLTWDGLATDVHRAIDALSVPRAILWGSSFGCLVALAAAARGPERISGLLLCHPPDPHRRPRFQKALLRWAEGRRDPIRATCTIFSRSFRLLAAWEALSPATLRRLPDLYRVSVEAATPAATLCQKVRLLASEPPGMPNIGPRARADETGRVAPGETAERKVMALAGGEDMESDEREVMETAGLEVMPMVGGEDMETTERFGIGPGIATRQGLESPSAAASLPVSIIAASWDTITPLAEVRRFSQRLPGARLRVLRFAGHGAAHSRPRTFERIVIEELRRLARL